MNELRVRKLEVGDVEAIGRIQATITKDDELLEFRQQIKNQINEPEKTGIVAEADGQVVGYMVRQLLFGGFGIKKSAWITLLGVDPDCMGQGIGRKLAEEMFKIYRKNNVKEVYSSVLWDSTDLLSFFKTLGFERSRFINLNKKLG
ncbi:MAG: GNAT family N-acetyltransferase [Deltaproteobacteria bacterium]|nr:GNAT family N-acetyltransferase [Deltaproteobacteria bacterium]